MAAMVAPLMRILGGVERQFPMLSQRDLVLLTTMVPRSDPDTIINLDALNKWMSHVDGCSYFLLASAQKINPMVTLEQVNTWGSILQRSNVARDLFIAAIRSGEEPEIDPNASGATAPVPQSREIGIPTPQESPTGSPV